MGTVPRLCVTGAPMTNRWYIEGITVGVDVRNC